MKSLELFNSCTSITDDFNYFCPDSKDKSSNFESNVEEFTLPWHSLVALGIFVSVYVKCTSASIPTGDAGNTKCLLNSYQVSMQGLACKTLIN